MILLANYKVGNGTPGHLSWPGGMPPPPAVGAALPLGVVGAPNALAAFIRGMPDVQEKSGPLFLIWVDCMRCRLTFKVRISFGEWGRFELTILFILMHLMLLMLLLMLLLLALLLLRFLLINDSQPHILVSLHDGFTRQINSLSCSLLPSPLLF